MKEDRIDKGTALAAVQRLLGKPMVAAWHAADLRGFGFGTAGSEGGRPKAEWALHIMCSWRLERGREVITGSFDWNEPEVEAALVPDDWDPAYGGSLQEAKLREFFGDPDKSKGGLFNQAVRLAVEDVDVNEFGDLVVRFSGDVILRVFASGARGEFWCVFERGELGQFYSCER